MSELAPFSTPVGTVLAAAVNQSIFYSIVGGNDLGMRINVNKRGVECYRTSSHILCPYKATLFRKENGLFAFVFVCLIFSSTFPDMSLLGI